MFVSRKNRAELPGIQLLPGEAPAGVRVPQPPHELVVSEGRPLLLRESREPETKLGVQRGAVPLRLFSSAGDQLLVGAQGYVLQHGGSPVFCVGLPLSCLTASPTVHNTRAHEAG